MVAVHYEVELANDTVEPVVGSHDAVEAVVAVHDKVELANDSIETVVAAHDAIEVEIVAHDAVDVVAYEAFEAVVAANDKVESEWLPNAVELAVAAHEEVKATHDAIEHGVAAQDATKLLCYLCATFHFIFQPNTAVLQK